MNLEDILFYLQDEVKRHSLIVKLKSAGENSFECHAFRQILKNLNLHKPPPGIEQTTLLKHTFQFLGSRETIKNASKVSKFWNLAAKTVRFDERPPHKLF